MIRGPLGETGFSPKFSGHETFPFRYGWLPKFVAFVRVQGDLSNSNNSLSDTMVRLGVGKNMVSSMRYWALATGICEPDSERNVKVSELGKWLLEDQGDRRKGGLDPYLEYPATIWALHWRLAGLVPTVFEKLRSTTWFWAFNHFSAPSFTRDSMLAELETFGRDLGWNLKSSATLRRDIDCFVRCYATSRNARGKMIEDTLECPLSELNLIRPAPGGRAYEFAQGDKPSLPDSVFAFAVAEYVACLRSGASVSLDALTYDVGSPGRVFRLGEHAVADRLARIEESSLGKFSWVDTAGVRQIQQVDQKTSPINILKQAYRDRSASRNAA